MGDWYWIGMLAGLGAALGVLFAGALAATRAGVVAAVALGVGAGLLAGLGIGEWDEAIGGAIGGLLGAAGATQLVQGTLRRGGSLGGTAVWIGLRPRSLGLSVADPGLRLIDRDRLLSRRPPPPASRLVPPR